jgi:hypothetical protein
LIFSVGLQFIVLVAGLMSLLLIWYKPVWGVFAAISIASLLDCFDVGTAIDAATTAAAGGGGLNIYGDDVACLFLVLSICKKISVAL